MTSQIARLLEIMATLRDPQRGCEWDLAQTFATIVPHTIEEAYEVADAVERGDPHEIKDELGDLFFQVVFQARIAEEAGLFDLGDVARSISEKLIARHPHIFGPHIFGGAETPNRLREEHWEELKAAERIRKGASSALDHVALALPALLRAQKLQKRAARTGFDWPDVAGPLAKVHEELEELADASSDIDRKEEAGDLLFAVVNLVRACGVDAEEALRAANRKFEARFKAMEQLAGTEFSTLSLDQQEELWQQVKSNERA